jgi:hypothetical protein
MFVMMFFNRRLWACLETLALRSGSLARLRLLNLIVGTSSKDERRSKLLKSEKSHQPAFHLREV